MNPLGTERVENRQGVRGLMVTGRRMSLRCGLRLRKYEQKKMRAGAEPENESEKGKGKPLRRKEEAKQIGKTMGAVLSMARRPWRKKRGREVESKETWEAMTAVSREKVKKLARVMETTLYMVAKSIAISNFRTAMKKRKDVVALEEKRSSGATNTRERRRSWRKG